MIILELQKFFSLWPKESFVQEKPVLESPTGKVIEKEVAWYKQG